MKYFLVILAFASIVVSFSVFQSFRAFRNLKYPELTDNKIETLDDFNSQFSYFPNITGSSIPVDALRASFAFNEKYFAMADDLLSKASEVNPYIGYSEFIKAKAFYALGNIDTATYYAKMAFQKWPKSLSNYTMYLKTLAFKGDTTSIQDAYLSINDVFRDRKPYSKEFVNYHSLAKLKYLITEYSDRRNINKEFILGSWIKSYEFTDGRVKSDSTVKLNFDKLFMTASNGVKYLYNIKRDTLYLYSYPANRLITKSGIQYSDQYETLILSYDPKTNVVEQFLKRSNTFGK